MKISTAITRAAEAFIRSVCPDEITYKEILKGFKDWDKIPYPKKYVFLVHPGRNRIQTYWDGDPLDQMMLVTLWIRGLSKDDPKTISMMLNAMGQTIMEQIAREQEKEAQKEETEEVDGKP